MVAATVTRAIFISSNWNITAAGFAGDMSPFTALKWSISSLWNTYHRIPDGDNGNLSCYSTINGTTFPAFKAWFPISARYGVPWEIIVDSSATTGRPSALMHSKLLPHYALNTFLSYLCSCFSSSRPFYWMLIRWFQVYVHSCLCGLMVGYSLTIQILAAAIPESGKYQRSGKLLTPCQAGLRKVCHRRLSWWQISCKLGEYADAHMVICA